MDYLYTLTEEQMVDYDAGSFHMLGVFSSLEAAQAAALAHLADPEVPLSCDGRILSIHRTALDARAQAESLGAYNPLGQWTPEGQLTPLGFYSCRGY